MPACNSASFKQHLFSWKLASCFLVFMVVVIEPVPLKQSSTWKIMFPENIYQSFSLLNGKKRKFQGMGPKLFRIIMNTDLARNLNFIGSVNKNMDSKNQNDWK